LIYLFFDFAIFPFHFFSLFVHRNLINIAGIDDDLTGMKFKNFPKNFLKG